MADPISASISAIVTYVSGSFAAVAAGTATLAQTATVVAVQVGVSAAATAVLTPQVDAAGSPTDWRADPDAAIHFVAGRRGVAGTIVHRDEWGKDNRYQSIVTVYGGAGPYKSIGSITADGESVTFSGSYGRQASGTWKDIFWGEFSLGAQPSTALRSPSDKGDPTIGGTMPGWGSAYKLSGKACAMFTMAMDKERERWPSGEPKILSVPEGMYCWDPRQDSTYPGGDGSCRLADPSTWVWSDNPLLHALKWCLGYYENGVLVGGIGAAVSGIDVAAYVEGANVCDANGWVVSAYPSTKDDKHQVLLAYLQAGGCRYARKGGKISCIVRTPRTSIVDVTAADTAGPFEIEVGADMLDRLNTVVPRCAMETHDWEMVAQAPVSVSAYVTADGARRERGIDYPYVAIQPSRGNSHQPAQLAAYDIVDSREPIRGRVPLKPYMAQIQPGDVFTIDEPGFLLDGVECLCVQREFDPQQDIVQITFVSETEGKHAFALGQDPTPPEPPGLTAPDIYSVDAPSDVAYSAVAGTGNQPAIIVTGTPDTDTAQSLIVEYRTELDPADGEPWDGSDSGWVRQGIYPLSTSRVTVTGLEPETAYQIGVRYISQFGVIGERKVLATVTTGTMVANPPPDILADLQSVIDLAADLDEYLSEAVLDLVASVDDLREFLDGLVFLEGLPIGVKLITERETRETNEEAALTERTTMSARIDDNVAAIIEEASVRATADSVEAAARTVLAGQVDDNEAAILQEASLRVTGDLAEANARQLLTVRVDDNEAAILTNATAIAGVDFSFAQLRDTLGAYNGDESAFILNELTVQAGSRGTLATIFTGIEVSMGDNESAISTLQSASSTQASLITSLTSDVDGNSASITTLLSVTDGLAARAALVINVNGVLTGYDIDGSTGDFVIAATTFAITDTSGTTPVYPFTYSGGLITMAANVRITGNAVVDGTLTAGALATGEDGTIVSGGTVINFYQQGTDPAPVADGSWWADTSANALYIRLSDAWEKIADISPDGGFSVSLSETSITGSGTTGSIAANPSGGSTPYSYRWECVNDSGIITEAYPNSPTSQTTTVSSPNPESGRIRCIVSDANGIVRVVSAGYTVT